MLNVEIGFDDTDEGLEVYIDTEELHLRSIRSSDAADYQKNIFSDPDVIKYFKQGDIYTEQDTIDETEECVELWKNKIPFSRFSVFKEDNLVGEVELRATSQPGEAEIGYAFAKSAQGQGIGSRSVKAVGINYAFELAKRKYEINGQVFSTMMATVHPNNIGSEKILHEKLEMELEEQIPKYGSVRNIYRKKIS